MPFAPPAPFPDGLPPPPGMVIVGMGPIPPPPPGAPALPGAMPVNIPSPIQLPGLMPWGGGGAAVAGAAAGAGIAAASAFGGMEMMMLLLLFVVMLLPTLMGTTATTTTTGTTGLSTGMLLFLMIAGLVVFAGQGSGGIGALFGLGGSQGSMILLFGLLLLMVVLWNPPVPANVPLDG